ncbi:galactosylceramide sulfotransferase-like [Monodelphis domestica]|uniref:galactosylceramide sulfotransferase-like n=1 Tax=Monodelphis domestica TaxID=13616 RepID=UPI0024E217FD|nr:galactosylceramide sulfotransferase-like [Monodelphis domestica]XP_056677473.1 galactosylceramide sulfotransferase-like [Monodelphis domestica]
MPSWRKPWHCMAKWLILGCLCTGFLLLFYSYASLQVFMAKSPAPARCSSPPTSPTNIPNDSCWPKLDIVFMKTHKTASSTLLNILFRLGQKHHLKFAFPSGYNDFNYPTFFRRTLVHNYQPGDCFNIICNHMRFFYSEVHSLVAPNTTFITVLRDPAHLFESSFHYFGMVVPFTWKLTGHNKLAKFLQNPTQYYNPQGYNAQFLHNLLFFDLGYNNELDPRSPQVEDHILEVEQRFHLVMLQEYFDESLVLLKDLMCWELEDILYFKLNARRASAVPQLTGELYQRATEWNQLDALLYRHFNASFWRKVEAFGRERMAREVANLRRENKRMERICIDGEHAVEAKDIKQPSLQPWQAMGAKTILGYNLKKHISHQYEQLCRKMVTPDIQYMTELGVNLWITKLWGYIRKFLQI